MSIGFYYKKIICGFNKGGDFLKEKPKIPEKREDSLMKGSQNELKKSSIQIPIIAVKGIAVLLCVLMVFVVGTFLHYHQITQSEVSAEIKAREIMQQNNDEQGKQIEALARTTVSLQADLARLNSLDAEIRQIVNNENVANPSQTGVSPTGTHKGQGGPTGPIQGQPEPSNLSDITKLANDLHTEVTIREQSLAELKQEALARQARLAATPSIWPVGGDITSRFGWRSSPWGSGIGGDNDSDYHPGIDIANNVGTAVFATADGEVVKGEWTGGYGNLVQIDHGNGIATLYGHNSQIIVHVGQVVKKGQVIAYMGSTGNSTGPHCHYEVRVNGTAVNPESFLVLK